MDASGSGSGGRCGGEEAGADGWQGSGSRSGAGTGESSSGCRQRARDRCRCRCSARKWGGVAEGQTTEGAARDGTPRRAPPKGNMAHQGARRAERPACAYLPRYPDYRRLPYLRAPCTYLTHLPPCDDDKRFRCAGRAWGNGVDGAAGRVQGANRQSTESSGRRLLEVDVDGMEAGAMGSGSCRRNPTTKPARSSTPCLFTPELPDGATC